MASAHIARRRILLASLAGLLVVCAAGGGAAWYSLRCDRASYQSEASVSWVQANEEYLFACGQVWHSLDTGKTWTQIPSYGLPPLLRDGRIAADRSAGRLYLAMMLAVPSNIHCLLCPLTEVQPVVYLSEDGGHSWQLTGHFPDGPSGLTSVRIISADPNHSNAGWIVLQTGEHVAFYATNTGGRIWRLTCVERVYYACDPPADFLAGHHARQN